MTQRGLPGWSAHVLFVSVCCDGELALEAYTWHVSRIWWWSRLISSLQIGNLAFLTNNGSTFTEGIPVGQLIWLCCIILIGLVNLLDYCFLVKQVACHFMNSCPNYCTDSLFIPHILISSSLSETVFNLLYFEKSFWSILTHIMYISCVAQALWGNFSFFVSVFSSRIEQDFCI